MSEKIFEYRLVKLNGKWSYQAKRLTFFTEKTVPRLHEWLKRGGDGEASYFAFEGERPSPPFPPLDIELPEVHLTDEQQTIVSAQQQKGCGCGKKKTAADRTKRPTDDCWVCAEKHIGSAYDTYAKEHGYRELNRIHYIGALNDAENHLAGIVKEYAEKIRSFRHDIQNGMEKTDAEWQALSKGFYDVKDNFFKTELFAKKYRKIYIFSNVETTEKIEATEADLLVFLNKAVNAQKYIDYPNKCVFHRADKPEYGKRRFDMANCFVFGSNGIPNAELQRIKADYDWNYEVKDGAVKSCSTGYMVALHLAEKFPESEIVLVNFGFEVENSTYRCPWHNWQFEDNQLGKFKHLY